MRPIINEIREIIISARGRGEKAETIASWLNISVASVYHICRLHKASGTIAPKPFPGRRTILSADQLSKIRDTIEAENDITLDELIEKLQLPIKKSRLSVVLIGMGFSFKKRLSIQNNSSVRMSKPSAPSGKKSKWD
jgi:transposase